MKNKANIILVSFLATIVLFLSACDSPSSSLAAYPSDPAVAIKKITMDLADYKTETLWQAMPKSYKSDVQQLVKLSSELIDEGTYNRAVALLGKIGKVMKSNKAVFLKLIGPQLNKSIPPHMQKILLGSDEDPASKWYDLVVVVITELAESDLGHHKNLKNLNIEKLLVKHMNVIYKQLAASSPIVSTNTSKLKSFNFSVKSVNDKEIKLTTNSGSTKVKEESWVKFEDRWIPIAMQVAWQTLMIEAKKNIQQAKSQVADGLLKAQLFLPIAEMAVARLESAKSEAELMQIIGTLGGLK